MAHEYTKPRDVEYEQIFCRVMYVLGLTLCVVGLVVAFGWGAALAIAGYGIAHGAQTLADERTRDPSTWGANMWKAPSSVRRH